MTLDEKRSRLGAILRGHGKVAVAFSGGMDSSLLCAIACEELGEGALAITIVSPMLPKSELDDARKVAALVGIRHILVDTSDIEDDVRGEPRGSMLLLQEAGVRDDRPRCQRQRDCHSA